MAVYKENIVDIDLASGTIHRSFLNHSIGTSDNVADHFGVRVFRNKEEVDLTGVSVQGYFRDSHGNNIAITSGNSVSGNVAEVVLPQACYNYEGQFTLAIKLIGSGVTGTVRIVDGMVDNTNTGGAVAPTETVPTYQEVLATYSDMVDIVEDYEEVVANQNAQISDLKNEVTSIEDKVGDIEELSVSFTNGKAIYYSNGKASTSSVLSYSGYKAIPAGYETLRLSMVIRSDNVNTGMAFYTSNGESYYLSGKKNKIDSSITNFESEIVDIPIPEGARYFRTSWIASDHSSYSSNTFYCAFIKKGTMETQIEELFNESEVLESDVSKNKDAILAFGEKVTSSDLTWTLGEYIDASGVEKTGAGWALSSYIDVGTGCCVINKSGNIGYNEKASSFAVHEYNGSTWLRRVFISDGVIHAIGNNCTRIRVVYGYNSEYSVTITNEILETYFSMVVVEESETRKASEAIQSYIENVIDAHGDLFEFGENWTGTVHGLYFRKTNNNTFYLNGTHTGSYEYRILSYDSEVATQTSASDLDTTKFTVKLVPGKKYRAIWEFVSGNIVTDASTALSIYQNDNGAISSVGAGVLLKDFADTTRIEREFVANVTDHAVTIYARSVAYNSTYRLSIIEIPNLINDTADGSVIGQTYSASKITELVGGVEKSVENTQDNLIRNYDALVYSSKSYTITKTATSSDTYRRYTPYVPVTAGDRLIFDIVDAATTEGTGGIAQIRFSFFGDGVSAVYKDYDATSRRISYTVPEGYTQMQIAYCIRGTNTTPVTANFGRVYVYKEKLALNEELIRIPTLEAVQEEVAELADKAGTAFPIEYNDRFFVNGRYIDCINPYKNGGSMQLKGQLHCHRTDNNGNILSTLQQIYNNYAPLYDFMNLTDYNAYANLSDFDDLVELNEEQSTYNLIQLSKGYELKIVAGGTLTRNPHLIVLNANEILTVPSGTMPYDAIKYLVEHGCIVDFAHPTYSELDADDAKEIKRDCRFIEVVNGHTSLSEAQWDAMLTQGNVVWGIGVSDCHGTSQDRIDSAYVKLFANEKNRNAIMESLLNGNFYASNGAAISSVSVTENGYVVTCAESATIDFVGADGEVLQTSTGASATYQFTGAESYVRAKVTISGEYAWTQPVIMASQIIRI